MGDDRALIDLRFDERAGASVVYRGISSLIDLSLTESGASVTELDAADLGLCELLSCVTEVGNVASARLEGDGRGTTLRLDVRSSSEIGIDDASRAIIESGFATIALAGTSVTVTLHDGGPRAAE